MSGFFAKLFSSKDANIIKSPVSGTVIPLSEVKDEAFSQGFLGKGVAIIPSANCVYAPVSGTIDSIVEAKHAINIVAGNGAEVLIHIGMDTVTLKGAPFTPKVKDGDRIKTGDALMEFDMEAIRAAGLETTTPVTIANSDDFADVVILASGTVEAGADLIEVKKK